MKLDQPAPVTIAFTLKDPKSPAEDFIFLSSEMFSKGLIFDRPRELRRAAGNPGRLELIVTFVDTYAMKSWLSEDGVLAFYDCHLKHYLRQPPQIVPYRDVTIDFDEVKTCACDTHRRLILEGQPPRQEYKGFITCGDCLWALPAYKLPDNIGLIPWSHTYRDVYKIFLRPGPIKAWAREQLSSYHSPLNAQGRKIARLIAKHFSSRTYYHLFVTDPNGLLECPNCGRQGREAPWQRHDMPDLVCKRCHIAYFKD